MRSSASENNQRRDSEANRGSVQSNDKEGVKSTLSNGVRNVAFEGENGTNRVSKEVEEGLGQSNDFNRDSIYRFTVNPMFSNPEEETIGDVDDQHIPLRNTMYLPTNTCK